MLNVNLDDCRGDSDSVSEELIVVRFLKIHFDVLKRFALGQVVVIGIPQKSRTKTTNKGFWEPMMHVECGHSAGGSGAGNR